MKGLQKLCVGIDISKDTFDAHMQAREVLTKTDIKIGHKKFDNSNSGITSFREWLTDRIQAAGNKLPKDIEPWIVLEYTGVYHENLAHTLYDADYDISLVLPNTSNNFAKSLNEHSKTDKVDARTLSLLGLERKLDPWKPFSENSLQMKALSRELQAVTEEGARIKCQFHAAKTARNTPSKTIARMEIRLALIKAQKKEIMDQLRQMTRGDNELQKSVNRLRTIPGIGEQTAFVLIAELDGFKRFETRAQLVKYCGLDVVNTQSGTSVNGRPYISKKGNKRVRRGLYMAGLSACTFDIFAKQYNRLMSKGYPHRKAMVAVMRKLLVIAYAMEKNQLDYDSKYEFKLLEQKRKNKTGQPNGQPAVTAPQEEGVLES